MPSQPPVGARGAPKKRWIVSALGVMQIFAWGSTFYLPAILGSSIAADTGWPLVWIVGGLSIVDVPDEEAAKMWAGRMAEACGWPQEVRRIT